MPAYSEVILRSIVRLSGFFTDLREVKKLKIIIYIYIWVANNLTIPNIRSEKLILGAKNLTIETKKPHYETKKANH